MAYFGAWFRPVWRHFPAAIIATVLAFVTISSHRALTDAVLAKAEASDQWAIGEGLLELGLVLCLYFISKRKLFHNRGADVCDPCAASRAEKAARNFPFKVSRAAAGMRRR